MFGCYKQGAVDALCKKMCARPGYINRSTQSIMIETVNDQRYFFYYHIFSYLLLFHLSYGKNEEKQQ